MEEKVVRTDHGRWETVIDEELGKDFLLRQESSIAMVRTGNVQACLVPDAKFRMGFLRDPSPEIAEFLAERKLTPKRSYCAV